MRRQEAVPSIPAASPNDSGFFQRIHDWFSRKERAGSLFPLDLLAHDPELTKLATHLERLSDYTGDLEPSLVALVKVRMTQRIRSRFCYDRERDYWSRKYPAAESQLRILEEGRERELFGKRELLALEYVDQVLSPESRISGEFFEKLKEIFTYREIVDLAMLIASESFFCCLHRALGDTRSYRPGGDPGGSRPEEEGS